MRADVSYMDLPRAHGSPLASAVLRHRPEDFQVEEELGYEPEGEGEHLWLWLEKRGMNTDQLARRLASIAGVRRGDVSYAGLKDRHAVTRQWCSIHLPKTDLEGAAQWQEPGWRVLRTVRARRKLRRGGARGNRFVITLRELHGDRQAVELRLREIAGRCVPNYFGAQRFGRDNLARAEAMMSGKLRVADRHLRGIYLSSLRSALFNAVLARRVRDHVWEGALGGEALNLAGSRSYFVADAIDDEIEQRLATGDIHPTGPLWGRGEPPSRGAALSLELAVVAACPEKWSQACVDAGMVQERRPLRLAIRDLHWDWHGDDLLQLKFGLPAGAYATAVIREIADTRMTASLD
ncbi:MAG: tRNA pseudouridine(13) synthase TruD [Gammaproteobacteria bacterium]|jgi:tRNA pseudouridine13 synthase